LKGPLVVAGWGFDIDNKPVPNASPNYPDNSQMYFEDNWLRKPWKWKCGPVDLRWDDRRKVWTAPSPMKIVRLKLCGPLLPNDCAHALMYMEDMQTDKDGNFLPWQDCCYGISGNAKVTVQNYGHRPVPEGFDITAFYDTYTERYVMLGHDDPLYIIQVLSDMNPGSMGIGRLVAVLASGADQCGQLVGRTVFIENPLNQPLCAGQYAVTYLRMITGSAVEQWCDWNCISSGVQWHIVLQASFRPLCIVTWVSLIECTDNETEDITCTISETGGDPRCYCDYEITCDPITDDWTEYNICVKDRQIWLQSAWSTEKAWEEECYADNIPGGSGGGGSGDSDCYDAVRPIDCYGSSATCNA
jgi:hypothetical protein